MSTAHSPKVAGGFVGALPSTVEECLTEGQLRLLKSQRSPFKFIFDLGVLLNNVDRNFTTPQEYSASVMRILRGEMSILNIYIYILSILYIYEYITFVLSILYIQACLCIAFLTLGRQAGAFSASGPPAAIWCVEVPPALCLNGPPPLPPLPCRLDCHQPRLGRLQPVPSKATEASNHLPLVDPLGGLGNSKPTRPLSITHRLTSYPGVVDWH